MSKYRVNRLAISTLVLSASVLYFSAFTKELNIVKSEVQRSQPSIPTSPPLNAAVTAKVLTGEQIKWQVVSSGGNKSTSASYVLAGTVGQTATGVASSANYRVNQGFWQNLGSSNCCTAATTGDVDGSGSVDISDLSAMVDYLFNSLPFPGTCFLEQDVDKSGAVDISDLQSVIDFLFNSVPLPSCP